MQCIPVRGGELCATQGDGEREAGGGGRGHGGRVCGVRGDAGEADAGAGAGVLL